MHITKLQERKCVTALLRMFCNTLPYVHEVRIEQIPDHELMSALSPSTTYVTNIFDNLIASHDKEYNDAGEI